MMRVISHYLLHHRSRSKHVSILIDGVQTVAGTSDIGNAGGIGRTIATPGPPALLSMLCMMMMTTAPLRTDSIESNGMERGAPTVAANNESVKMQAKVTRMLGDACNRTVNALGVDVGAGDRTPSVPGKGHADRAECEKSKRCVRNPEDDGGD